MSSRNYILLETIALKELEGAAKDTPRLSPEARAPLNRVAFAIEQALLERGLPLDTRQYCNLLKKLNQYCHARHWTIPKTVSQLERVVEPVTDLFAENPAALGGKATLLKMLDNPVLNMTRAGEMLKRWEPRRARKLFAFTFDSDYALEELLFPEHLIEEAAAIGHCMATKFHYATLQGMNMREDHPEAAEYLYYAELVRRNISRLFSLRGPCGPAVSIRYDMKDCAITEIEAYDKKLGPALADEPFFPALCDALGAIGLRMNVDRIVGLPKPSDRRRPILTRRGVWISQDEALELPSGDILKGKFNVADEALGDKKLRALAANARLVLDVTLCKDVSHLPARIAAKVYTKAQDLHLPGLVEAGDVEAPKAHTVDLPALCHARSIKAPMAWRVGLAQLETVSHVDFMETAAIHTPRLREVLSKPACE